MDNSPGSSAEDEPGASPESEDDFEDTTNNQSSVSKDVDDELSNFRDMWQIELKSMGNGNKKRQDIKEESVHEEDQEQKARTLYLRGAEMERLGNFYEAIQWYRRAHQLVPDIDFKVHQKSICNFNRKDDSAHESENEDHDSDDNSENTDDEDDDSNKDQPLLSRIQKRLNKAQYFCTPQFQPRATHISELPMEIILYILKWVVSSELDLRSLELCSVTCRGFYLCARDQEIWRLACIRAWGVNCGNLPINYPTWRDMFINRSRLHYNGCYISKTTYIRHGENSFQDQFYRPWHLVAYYRYLRFFPDGLVFMMTTSDEPAQCLGLMKTRHARAPLLFSGHYRLKDDKVTIVVQPQEVVGGKQLGGYKRGRKRQEILYESGEQSFHLEFRIQSVKKYKHVQLEWTHYSIFTRYKNGVENESTFELATTKYPPLRFSRVKSYTQESFSPLQ